MAGPVTAAGWLRRGAQAAARWLIEDVEIVDDYDLASTEQRARIDQALAYVDAAQASNARNMALQDLCIDVQRALRPPPPDLRALRMARRPAVPVTPGSGRSNPEGAPPA